MMLEKLEHIYNEALSSLSAVKKREDLESWRITYLGRKSALMTCFDEFKNLPKEQRPQVGQKANQIKAALEEAFTRKEEEFKQALLLETLSRERLDVTLPGRKFTLGRLHPSTQNLREICRVLNDMGFQTYLSRDVETDEYNFQLLNFPVNHPAREMQDSFYIDGKTNSEDNPIVLRTHTSPGQIHAMREFSSKNPQNPPPVRIILPGMCYRYEQLTYRSEIQFHQVEGLAIGKNITFSDLKGTLSDFARRLFGSHVRSRFRASHFPFTEPSAEMDIECFVCGGSGCGVCKYTGWLEILGCGMVHPVVLANGGYDPEKYTGFAFGLGPERILMLRRQITDIRYFWGNDLRFLEQF